MMVGKIWIVMLVGLGLSWCEPEIPEDFDLADIKDLIMINEKLADHTFGVNLEDDLDKLFDEKSIDRRNTYPVAVLISELIDVVGGYDERFGFCLASTFEHLEEVCMLLQDGYDGLLFRLCNQELKKRMDTCSERGLEVLVRHWTLGWLMASNGEGSCDKLYEEVIRNLIHFNERTGQSFDRFQLNTIEDSYLSKWRECKLSWDRDTMEKIAKREETNWREAEMMRMKRAVELKEERKCIADMIERGDEEELKRWYVCEKARQAEAEERKNKKMMEEKQAEAKRAQEIWRTTDGFKTDIRGSYRRSDDEAGTRQSNKKAKQKSRKITRWLFGCK